MDVEIKTGMEAMDFDMVTSMLSATYWAKDITKEEVIVSAKNSALVIGVFQNGAQVGFARALSDTTRFAYVLDVVIAEHCRGNGYGEKMLEGLLQAPELKNIHFWLLSTRDAHKFYQKFGFAKVSRPDDLLELRKEKAADRIFTIV
ncbi:GNAT family N-acetyltransferase [Clostridia bacterium OttesenSCG-928-F22]|nr:GNAT family N-acetyltransferase [Clostridia bacterium OttesenSCG-928-F22]